MYNELRNGDGAKRLTDGISTARSTENPVWSFPRTETPFAQLPTSWMLDGRSNATVHWESREGSGAGYGIAVRFFIASAGLDGAMGCSAMRCS